MPQESYAKIWTTIGLLILYTSLNMYLYIQGSELVFGYPDFSKIGKQTISFYAMLIFIPSFLTFLWVTFNYIQEHNEFRKWTEGFPIAFNLAIDPLSVSGRKYQTFFFMLFYVVPIILQVHSIKKFFSTPVFINSEEYVIVANDFKSHLFNFEPFRKSFGNEYRFGDFNDNSVTFFPAYESWAFLLLELLILFLFIKFVVKIFKIRLLPTQYKI